VVNLVIELISHSKYNTGKTEVFIGHNNFCRLEGKPTEIKVTSVGQGVSDGS
jgi:hypothetical protein